MADFYNPSIFSFLITISSLSLLPCFTHSLSTISISETSNQTLICALIHPSTQQPFLNCTSFPTGIQIPLNNNTASSFTGIVAGDGFFCALSSLPSSSPITSILACWRFSSNGTIMEYKRIYHGSPLNQLVAGNSHICGLVEDEVDGVVESANHLECWQWHGFNSSNMNHNFSSIAVGQNFVCGLSQAGKVSCFGSNSEVVGKEPSAKSYSVVSAGFNHVCALTSETSSLDCWGDMKGEKPAQGRFTSLALGENRSCALRPNGTAVCWGENSFSLPETLKEAYFVSIEAKRSVFCGVASSNFALYCWGNPAFGVSNNFTVFRSDVMPGPCRRECPSCSRPLPGYGKFCEHGYRVCQPCLDEPTVPIAPSPPPLSSSPSPSPSLSPSPSPSPRRSKSWSSKMVAFLVVGCVGSFALVLVACFFVFKFCNIRGCRVHDSGRLEDLEDIQIDLPADQHHQGTAASTAAPGQPVLEKRLSNLVSMGANGASLEEFSFQVLLEATANFSEEHQIGTGGYGVVYYAKLEDGREVAIKRAETSASSSYVDGQGQQGQGHGQGQTRRQEDKDSAFVNELEYLSRLNHKNLVRLLGFYEDEKERILVYDYMKNGTLHDHLHKLQLSPLFSWPFRINVALDAARAIEYLHVYAVPPIIHRDIKSSNILLDDTWRAKVSDFGLSLMGPADDESHLSLRAAGTFGYMDPEYYRLQHLTTKSDVYSFGVVLLELLSGYNAIHKNENGLPRNVVDFVVPYIVKDEIHRVLDPRVAAPSPFEIQAVAYVGYLAADCVSLFGRDRPSMTNIVCSLERALKFCLAGPSRSRSRSSSPSGTESST